MSVRVISLCGPSGSGKSSLSKLIQQQRGGASQQTFVFSSDDYFIDHSAGISTVKDEVAAQRRERVETIDFARLERDLVGLLERLSRQPPPTNGDNDDALVIVEGFLTLCAPSSLLDRISKHFFLWVDIDVCRERRVARKQRTSEEAELVRRNFHAFVWPMFEKQHEQMLRQLRASLNVAVEQIGGEALSSGISIAPGDCRELEFVDGAARRSICFLDGTSSLEVNASLILDRI